LINIKEILASPIGIVIFIIALLITFLAPATDGWILSKGILALLSIVLNTYYIVISVQKRKRIEGK